MAVKPISKDSSTVPAEGPGSIDAELRALMGAVRQVVTALKRGGPMPSPLQEAFEQASLGPRHVGSVMTVTLEGALSVSELAEHLGLSLSTTSLMVGELSRAGILERAEDETDRRRTIVRLNEAYREDGNAWLNERLDPFRRTLARMSPRARADFLEGWRILAEETARIGNAGDADCTG